MLISLSFLSHMVNATIHQVNVSDFQFSPQSTTAVCGDTVRWVWVNGTHTTTSASVPAGAATWNANITSSSTSFDYKVTVAGNYGYICTPHAATMGMAGAIIVTCTPSGVADLNNSFLSSAYPNPFSGKVIIEMPAADLVSFYNVLGENVKTFVTKGQTKVEINASDIMNGIYFYSIIKEGVVIETRRIIKD